MSAVRQRAISASKYIELLEQQDHYRQQFVDAMEAAGIDVLIGPPAPTAALTPAEFNASYGLLYAGLFNLLSVPAGVVPATRVRASEEHIPRSRNSVDSSCARVENESTGLPVGVHVASRWWREDLTLVVMKRLEEHFQSTADYPRTPAGEFGVFADPRAAISEPGK